MDIFSNALPISPSARRDRASILIVDDSPDDLHGLLKKLEQKGYEVWIATSGSTALTYVEEVWPDLILMDVRMPEMDGYELCARLKANVQAAQIPVIFISGLDDSLKKLRAFESGGVDYITKPLDIQETLARIDQQLKIRYLQRQLEEQNLRLQQEVLERRLAEQELADLNAKLLQQVHFHATELQLAYSFEATLKRITDRVRDSLDENQIMQTAVQELAQVVGAESCNAALYDLNQEISSVHFEHTDSSVRLQGRVLQMGNAPELYGQLLNGFSFQFCSLMPNVERGRVAMLACPILEDTQVLGDLWLVRPCEAGFTEQDIRLVQQVANQCAIALRQAKLYQTAQAQVEELAQLNYLKDDFLNTISHELRTPMTSIKMATQLLEITLKRLNLPASTPSPFKYLTILNDAYEREIRLINNLIELSWLSAGNDVLLKTPVYFQDWIPDFLDPFNGRIQDKQQVLQCDIPADLPLFLTDPSYLSRLLIELLDNACKYTPMGGTIRIAVSLSGVGEENQWFYIQVANSGSEIPAPELMKIFDKFYRIRRPDPWEHGGSGLGLALAKKLVTHLHGSIEATSMDGWTTFTVRLPQLPS